jgi:hypothetical protein
MPANLVSWKEMIMSTASTPAEHGTVTRRNPATMWDSTANGHSQISIAEAGRMA